MKHTFFVQGLKLIILHENEKRRAIKSTIECVIFFEIFSIFSLNFSDDSILFAINPDVLSISFLFSFFDIIDLL